MLQFYPVTPTKIPPKTGYGLCKMKRKVKIKEVNSSLKSDDPTSEKSSDSKMLQKKEVLKDSHVHKQNSTK